MDGDLSSETHKKTGTYTTSGSKVVVKYKEGNNETVSTISISDKTLTLSLVKE
ncbi:lipocalin family protein [Capnocytophaga gingivalis]